MIAEFFYPKKLKDAIRELESEHNIRYEPLDGLCKEINVVTIIACLLVVLTIASGDYVSLLLIVVLYFVTTYYLLMKRGAEYYTFIFGERQKIRIVKIGYRYFRNTVLKYEIISNKKIGEIRLDFTLYKSDDIYDNCIVYAYVVRRRGKYIVLPDIKEVKQLYCLNKKLMERN